MTSHIIKCVVENDRKDLNKSIERYRKTFAKTPLTLRSKSRSVVKLPCTVAAGRPNAACQRRHQALQCNSLFQYAFRFEFCKLCVDPSRIFESVNLKCLMLARNPGSVLSALSAVRKPCSDPSRSQTAFVWQGATRQSLLISIWQNQTNPHLPPGQPANQQSRTCQNLGLRSANLQVSGVRPPVWLSAVASAPWSRLINASTETPAQMIHLQPLWLRKHNSLQATDQNRSQGSTQGTCRENCLRLLGHPLVF